MEAKTWALGEILKPERRYIIPTFQRSYEWTRGKQWQLLFADLVATADRLHHERVVAKLTGSEPDEAGVAPHFLGAVVCDTLPFPAGGVALRSVIDGQQRLSTVQLLLRGLLDVVQEVDAEGELKGKAKALTKMISNDEDSATTPEDVYKLWPRRDDRGLWPAVMADTVPSYTNDDHLYLQARQYFADATREALADTPESERSDRLRALVDAVDTLFKIVVIDLDKNDDAQVIFEVLNGRQTELSASDLVKNLIFLRAEFAKAEHLEELYDRYWAGFDDKWWKKKVGTGHAQRYRRDVLLSVWLTATTASDVSVGNLYGEVRGYLDREKPKTEELLADLKSFATAYEEIYAVLPVSDQVIRQAYDRLIELNNLTAIPVLAWMRTLPESALSAEDHRAAVQAIESLLSIAIPDENRRAQVLVRSGSLGGGSDALVSGTLAASGSCVGVKVEDVSYPVVFPSGTTSSGEAIELPSGVELSLGDQVTLGGGFYSPPHCLLASRRSPRTAWGPPKRLSSSTLLPEMSAGSYARLDSTQRKSASMNITRSQPGFVARRSKSTSRVRSPRTSPSAPDTTISNVPGASTSASGPKSLKATSTSSEVTGAWVDEHRPD